MKKLIIALILSCFSTLALGVSSVFIAYQTLLQESSWSATYTILTVINIIQFIIIHVCVGIIGYKFIRSTHKPHNSPQAQ